MNKCSAWWQAVSPMNLNESRQDNGEKVKGVALSSASKQCHSLPVANQQPKQQINRNRKRDMNMSSGQVDNIPAGKCVDQHLGQTKNVAETRPTDGDAPFNRRPASRDPQIVARERIRVLLSTSTNEFYSNLNQLGNNQVQRNSNFLN